MSDTKFKNAVVFEVGLSTDTIAEETAAAGVTIDGLRIKDGGISPTTSSTLGTSGSSGSTLTTTIDTVNAGAGAGHTVVTADDAVKIGDAGNPTVDFPGTGAVTFSGNPTINTGTGTLTAGGAVAITGTLTVGGDVVFARQAASVGEFGSADSVYVVNATLGVRAASGDANPTFGVTGSTISLGAGGATAPDWTLARQAANVGELGSGDSLYSVGSASIGRRNASADANATIALTATGLELGAGGATASDCLVDREGADIVRVNDALVTTDAVASGLSRRVGGSVLRTVAESADVAGAEAVFASGSVTLPAATAKVGTRVGFTALIRVEAVSGSPTAQIRLRVGASGTGGTLAFDTNARTVADEDIISIDGYLDCRSTGAGGTLTGVMQYRISAPDTLSSAGAAEWGQDVAGSSSGTWTVAIDTTQARDITLTGTTDDAATHLRLESMRVWLEA